MPQPGVRCEGHDDLVKTAGITLEATREHGRQLSSIFDKLATIQSALDIYSERADARDCSISNLHNAIKVVDTKIENGIRSEIKNILGCLENIRETSERRKIARDKQAKEGFRGFIRSGYEQVKHQAAFIFVGGSILMLVWVTIFSLLKIGIFHEGPLPLLKLFGIG